MTSSHSEGHPPTRVGKPVPIFSAPEGVIFLNHGPFPKLSAAVWIAPNSTSAVLLLAAPTHEAVAADFDLDPARWYLTCPGSDGYAVSILQSGGQRNALGVYAAQAVVPVRLVVAGRDVNIVHIECVA